MNTNESLIMNSEHQPLVLFSVVNQVMLKSYPTVTYFVVAVNNKQTVSLTLLRPGQTLVTFQRNILQHCCMMLRHVLNGVAKRTQHFHHFQRNMPMFMCPWRATSGPSAHALVQQCCVNVVERVQHHATSKMLHEKFDRFQI